MCNDPTRPKIGRAPFTNEQVQDRLNKFGLTLLSSYTRNHDPIKIRCKCGVEYETTLKIITSGKDTCCLKCEFYDLKRLFNNYGTEVLTTAEEYLGRDCPCLYKCFCGKCFEGAPYKQLNSFYKGSCGCMTRIKSVDLAGIKFNKFTVLNNNLVRINGVNYLECQCECGKRTYIAHHYILGKKTQMCNICSARHATKKVQNENARQITAYLNKNQYTQLSPYKGTLRPIKLKCVCGKVFTVQCKNLLKLARKNFKLNCRCNKLKNGRMTSNQVFKLHELLGKGIHNFKSKAGCIDIALCHKGRKIAIEYDEWFWHKNLEDRDKKKTKKLISDGWLVLRIRVSSHLPSERLLLKSLDKLVTSNKRFLAITHKSWKGYLKTEKDLDDLTVL